jgi:hypothetical protein
MTVEKTGTLLVPLGRWLNVERRKRRVPFLGLCRARLGKAIGGEVDSAVLKFRMTLRVL